jgi:DNA-binding CsgD family transcriptional regulator
MAKQRPSLDPPTPETPLTPLELQVAILFAKGVSTEAIHQQVFVVSQRKVEFTVHEIFKKMGVSLSVPITSLTRRDMYDWMRARGLLPADGDLEAVLAPTISALENWLEADGWLQPHEREGVEKELAERKAALAESRRAMRVREPFVQEG